MTKTKRTLFISSLIMLLALVVTIVSVSAAWFGDATSVTKDGFYIDSDTLQEFTSIKVDSDITAEGGTKLWPAIAKKGALIANGGVIAPTGATLKTNENSCVDVGAQCAVIYFPITFIGSPDEGYTDQRKSLMLCVDSVSIDKYVTKNDDDTITVQKDFKDEFNIEMSIVNVTGTGKDAVITEMPMDGVDPSNLTDNQIFYKQPGTDQKPESNLYMLVKSGTTYYVRATIYFNKIDEECNPELLYTTISFNFQMNMLKRGESNWVDIRTVYKP